MLILQVIIELKFNQCVCDAEDTTITQGMVIAKMILKTVIEIGVISITLSIVTLYKRKFL